MTCRGGSRRNQVSRRQTPRHCTKLSRSPGSTRLDQKLGSQSMDCCLTRNSRFNGCAATKVTSLPKEVIEPTVTLMSVDPERRALISKTIGPVCACHRNCAFTAPMPGTFFSKFFHELLHGRMIPLLWRGLFDRPQAYAPSQSSRTSRPLDRR